MASGQWPVASESGWTELAVREKRQNEANGDRPQTIFLQRTTSDGFDFIYAKRTQFRIAELGVGYGKWHMVVDLCEVKSGGCHEGESSQPMPELRLGRVVEQDSHRVIENSTNHKIGILSHGGNGRGRSTGPERRRPAEPPWRREDATKSAKRSQFEIDARLGIT